MILKINVNIAFDLIQAVQTLDGIWLLTWILAAAMLVDIISGLAAAIGTKTLNSTVSWRGMCKKVGIWCFVALAALLQLLVPSIPVLAGTVIGFIVSEAISILENGGRLGILPPLALGDVLEKLRQGPAIVIPSAHVDVTVIPPADAILDGRRINDPKSPSVEIQVNPRE